MVSDINVTIKYHDLGTDSNCQDMRVCPMRKHLVMFFFFSRPHGNMMSVKSAVGGITLEIVVHCKCCMFF